MGNFTAKQPGPLGASGQEMWDYLTEQMPVGILENVDQFALYGTCQWWDVFQKWAGRASVQDTTMAYKSTCMAGTAYKHFIVGIRGFGLTPKDRKELDYDAEANGTDAFSEWMKKRMGDDPARQSS